MSSWLQDKQEQRKRKRDALAAAAAAPRASPLSPPAQGPQPSVTQVRPAALQASMERLSGDCDPFAGVSLTGSRRCAVCTTPFLRPQLVSIQLSSIDA